MPHPKRAIIASLTTAVLLANASPAAAMSNGNVSGQVKKILTARDYTHMTRYLVDGGTQTGPNKYTCDVWATIKSGSFKGASQQGRCTARVIGKKVYAGVLRQV